VCPQINDAGEMMEAIYLDSYKATDVRHGWVSTCEVK
jgi:hypothetical protein